MPKSETTGIPSDDQLEALFAEARAAAPDLPEGLAARMLADADAVQQGFAAAPLPQGPDTAPRPGWFARAFAGIGGWPALAGFATATVAGVWIGMSPPALVASEAAYYTSGGGTAEDLYLVDTMPAFDQLAQEG